MKWILGGEYAKRWVARERPPKFRDIDCSTVIKDGIKAFENGLRR
jgi:hypothetical protein